MDDSTQQIREDLAKIDSKLLRLCNTVDVMNGGRTDDMLNTLKAIEKHAKSTSQAVNIIGVIVVISVLLAVCGVVSNLFSIP